MALNRRNFMTVLGGTLAFPAALAGAADQTSATDALTSSAQAPAPPVSSQPAGKFPLTLSMNHYRSKVLGCWLGKNAGGTLGTPLEQGLGQKEPFNVSFYPKLQPGGMPNDDLEIQLIWLLALEQRGLDITCRDLADYWLNYVRYNYDEYGLHKTNLRQGLCPPVSGWYNNYFRNCMGCPIRSEIWACVAPGLPDVAADYAWHDAVVDHAMGESVYGEMFNAALQSAAFFMTDRQALLDVGLSVIPEKCKTAEAVRKAREAHARKMSWLEARNFVMEACYSPIAQYSPINLGFQTIGWLYGEDFGDMMCKAVNCGWDTDCTGATVGALYGIAMGIEKLPEKWTAPLGRTVTTAVASGGLAKAAYPATIDELTERTMAIGRQVMAKYPGRVEVAEKGASSQLNPRERIEIVDQRRIGQIQKRPQNAVSTLLPALEVLVMYPETPVVSEKQPMALRIVLKNRGSDAVEGRYTLDLPEGFSFGLGEREASFQIEGSGEKAFEIRVAAQSAAKILTANVGWLKLSTHRRPALDAIPVVMMGARRWLTSQVLAGQALECDDALLNDLRYDAAPDSSKWSVANWQGNELDVEPLFGGKPGVIYLRHFVYNPEKRKTNLGVSNNGRMKLWLNGKLIKSMDKQGIFRPGLGGDGQSNTVVELPEGWSHVLIKLERMKDPLQAHFTAAYQEGFWHGMDDLEQTRFPWECGDALKARRNYQA